MAKQLFREKSLEKIESPEQINAYIKTSSLRAWVLLSAILILTVGIFVWGIFGVLETTVTAVAVAENGAVRCYIAEEDREAVTEETVFRISGQAASAKAISALPVLAADTISPYAMHVGGLSQGEWVYTAELATALADGIYKAEIVIDRVNPISFLLN